MRTLLEITTFHTPIDSENITFKKSQEVDSMLRDFLTNNALLEEEEEIEDPHFQIHLFHLPEKFFIVFKEKKHEFIDKYHLPYLTMSVVSDNETIDTVIVTDLLSTVSHFFSGSYVNEYFVDIDSNYEIDAMNAGKKYNLADLKHIDLSGENMDKNKKMLDSLYYLRLSLDENLKKIHLAKNQENSHENSVLNGVISLAEDRMSMNEQALNEQISQLDAQIRIVTNYFISQSS